MEIFALGLGLASTDSSNNILEAFFPQPLLRPKGSWVEEVALKAKCTEGGTFNIEPQLLSELVELIPGCPNFKIPQGSQGILTFLPEDQGPKDVGAAYLKLHLLSHRLAKPREINMDGIFGALPNIAWTSSGAISLEDLPQKQLEERMGGSTLKVFAVDKFPPMTDYVVPKGVRIADTARVRLGAYVGEGTTIMHEGFINFNAGSIGPNMIEGRISAGVIVGEGTDLGGGCSTMGTLSGGNDIVVYVGKNCLIGANAGCGIPLGDGCIIEAGLYVTGGSKVRKLDQSGKVLENTKAATLAGKPNLLFRRNSLDGAIEVLPIKSKIALNTELHTNQ